jgi:hypothetical protein
MVWALSVHTVLPRLLQQVRQWDCAEEVDLKHQAQFRGAELWAYRLRIVTFISPDRWELNFSYPVEDPVPDLSSLSKVFREGESAMSNIAQEIPRFGSLADVSSISDAVKPHLQPVKDAVQAVQGIAGVQAGRVMFGLSASGPGIGQRPTTTSIEVTATITVTF